MPLSTSGGRRLEQRGPSLLTLLRTGGRRSDIRQPSVGAGELYLLKLAQKGMGISRAKMLATNVVTKEDMLWQRRKLITVGSRTRNQIAGIHKKGELSVLQRAHPLAALYMRDAHEKGHEGILTTPHRSRNCVDCTQPTSCQSNQDFLH